MDELQEERIKCYACTQEFSSFAKLNRHQKEVHQKLRPFFCSRCHQSYSRKEHFENHLFVKHRFETLKSITLKRNPASPEVLETIQNIEDQNAKIVQLMFPGCAELLKCQSCIDALNFISQTKLDLASMVDIEKIKKDYPELPGKASFFSNPQISNDIPIPELGSEDDGEPTKKETEIIEDHQSQGTHSLLSSLLFKLRPETETHEAVDPVAVQPVPFEGESGLIGNSTGADLIAQTKENELGVLNDEDSMTNLRKREATEMEEIFQENDDQNSSGEVNEPVKKQNKEELENQPRDEEQLQLELAEVSEEKREDDVRNEKSNLNETIWELDHLQ